MIIIFHKKEKWLFSNPITGKLIRQIFILVIFIPVLSYSQNLLNGPNDILFDEKNNRYLVANWIGNSIVAIDLQGDQYYFKNRISHAHGMEIIDSLLCVASYHNLLLIDLSTADIIQNIFPTTEGTENTEGFVLIKRSVLD